MVEHRVNMVEGPWLVVIIDKMRLFHLKASNSNFSINLFDYLKTEILI